MTDSYTWLVDSSKGYRKAIGMIYRGCTITQTETTTDTPHGIRKVYAIEGAIDKPAAQRPFITSMRAAKEYISDKIE